jgi:PPOX class probable F420-dependent enzyme
VTEDEARQRFAEARVARLATVDPTDSPHLVPICFAVDGSTIYSAVDDKPKTTRDLKRLRNMDGNPKVTLLVDHYEDDWERVWWVRVDGTAHVVDEHEHARRLLEHKYPQYRDGTAMLGRIVVVHAHKWRFWSYR